MRKTFNDKAHRKMVEGEGRALGVEPAGQAFTRGGG